MGFPRSLKNHLQQPWCWVWQQNGSNDIFQCCKLNNTHTKMTAIQRRIQWWAWAGNWRFIGGDIIVSKSNLPSCWVSHLIGQFDSFKCRKVTNTTTETTTINWSEHWCIGMGEWSKIDGATWFWKCFLYVLGTTEESLFQYLLVTQDSRWTYENNHNATTDTVMCLDGILINYWWSHHYFKKLSLYMLRGLVYRQHGYFPKP